jgi:hypothetical protein
MLFSAKLFPAFPPGGLTGATSWFIWRRRQVSAAWMEGGVPATPENPPRVDTDVLASKMGFNPLREAFGLGIRQLAALL